MLPYVENKLSFNFPLALAYQLWQNKPQIPHINETNIFLFHLSPLALQKFVAILRQLNISSYY